ncbi:heat shock protein 70, partial [Aphelenchoides avenae]
VLGKLKENAEEFLGHEVKDAVITVPAYFNDSQRQATKTAGTIAGFNVLQVLNEPTAAAIAYGFKNPGEGKRTLLVFDLGGGTFDVSVLEVDGGKFDVRAVAGDTHLGGEDFDERMVQHCVAEFKKKGGKDISSNQKALPRLRAACVEAKHALSSGVQTSIEVAALADGIDFTTTMTRACFEAICEDLFEKTVDEVKKALEDAKLTKSDIDEVVLVGGSTRIPKVRQLLSKFFDSKDLKKNINPDEAVAYGAAILAAQLSGEASKQDEHVANSNVRLRDLALADITPLSLGLEIADGAMCTLIPRNSKIPVKETRECTTDLDHETYIVIKIYEGERALAKDNHHLANLTMSGFRSAKASGGIWPMIQVTFEIDTNGILHVSAQDKESGESTEVIVDGRGRLPKAEIERMIRDAETHKAQDAVVRAKLLAKDNLDRLVRKIQRALAASPGAIPPSEAQNVRDKCTEAERVLNDASKDELERLYADLDAVWQPIDGYF